MMCVCVCVRKYIDIYIASLYIYICVYIYISVYMCVHIHGYINTYNDKKASIFYCNIMTEVFRFIDLAFGFS